MSWGILFFVLLNVFYPTVYHIKEGGWVRISEQDSKDLHYAYAEGKTLTQ